MNPVSKSRHTQTWISPCLTSVQVTTATVTTAGELEDAHAHTPETQSSTPIKVSKCSGAQALPGLARQDWRCMQRHAWPVRYADGAFFVFITPAALFLRLHRHSCVARVANRKVASAEEGTLCWACSWPQPLFILFPMLTKQPDGNPSLRHDRHVTPFDSVSHRHVTPFDSVSSSFSPITITVPGPCIQYCHSTYAYSTVTQHMLTVLSLNICIQYCHSTQAWGRAQCTPRFLFQSGFRVWAV